MKKHVVLFLLLCGFIANRGYCDNINSNYGFYSGLKIGTNFTNIKFANGEYDIIDCNVKTRLNPGILFGGFIGYRFCNNLRSEFEVSFDYENVRNLKKNKDFMNFVKGHSYSVLWMVNALYDLDINLPISPFIGGGIGYFSRGSQLKYEPRGFSNFFTKDDLCVKSPHKKYGFAYQLIFGITYPICQGIESSIAYHFVDEIKVAQSHNIEIALRKFF